MYAEFGQPAVDLLLKHFRRHKILTYLHAERVAHHCREIAKELKLNPQDIKRLELSALLHEVGTLHTTSEYEIPIESLRIIEQWGLNEEIDTAAVLQYGENLDGTGYPYELKHNDIHLTAKILRVAISFDRITTSPFGNPLLCPSAALEYLYSWIDILFDGEVVEGLKRILDRKKNYKYRFKK